MANSSSPSDGGAQTNIGGSSQYGESTVRRTADAVPEWVWPALVPCVSVAIVLTYLVTHPYPAYGAGLYLQIAEEIIAHGYGLPESIPLYTADGVPFAYPPLMFGVAAVLLDLGLDPITISLAVPAVVTAVHPVVYYFVARELLPSRRQAGLAAMLLAVTPDVLQWHLSAGGLVRAPAFLFVLLGVYTGLRVHKRGELKLVAVGTVLFGLTILTHPVYTVFFGMSWLLVYLFFDRTIVGLVAGAFVAGGGILVASPWWFQVVQIHGPDIFFAAAGTHSGLAGGLGRFLDIFVYKDIDMLLPFFLLSFAGAVWFLKSRRYFLPTWLLASGYVIGKDRYLFVAGSMMAAALLVEVVVPWFRRHASLPESRRAGTAVALAVVVLAATVGGLFAAGALNSAYEQSSTQPAFMDGADHEAMQWVAANTESGAQFVVLGDAAEWFPLFTDRGILVGPWGVEWTSPEQYDRQLDLYTGLSACEDANCVTETLDENDVSPDYLYVPKGEYTVRGEEFTADGRLRRSLIDAQGYEPVYENEGAAVFRVTGAAE
ncbi:Dolichyl-phosphate-mannose-protein mannosyltransferase [Halogranum amylolyticum]|uniref:Dolichyl-phosphate-mannose-protein mannosyltransferase n=1 Tax=Halogranum amylolyticum TaxID=660520 RepID=A0A1H8WE56_9EURY|nr:glycosyltransferase family 39 protein [Halogranum amylolyticum]SEP25849.1 Dolichyl-phosphate-mannose-protein mannosyltransferase [Halogranum amylolyticum]